MSDTPRRGESSGSSTTQGYMIEARSAHLPHVRVGDQTFTKDWSFVQTEWGWPGVPNRLWSADAISHGMLTYTAAQALMGWIASAERGDGLGLEFRLAKFECKAEFKIKRLGATEPRSFFEEERQVKVNVDD